QRSDLRFPIPVHFSEVIQGSAFEKIVRRSKYILVYLSSGFVLIWHLGMSGRVKIMADFSPEMLEKHDHVGFFFADGMAVIFNDPRRFGFMDLAGRAAVMAHPLIASIGVEPLDAGFSADY